MAIQVISADANDQAPTETSPLLGHQNGQTVEPTNAQPRSSENSSDVENTIALAEEPSTKKLVVIMAAIWTGVFFAALGMFFLYLALLYLASLACGVVPTPYSHSYGESLPIPLHRRVSYAQTPGDVVEVPALPLLFMDVGKVC